MNQYTQSIGAAFPKQRNGSAFLFLRLFWRHTCRKKGYSMFKIIKRLPPAKTLLAVLFLLLQISCSLYLPYLTADILNNCVVVGDTSRIWQKGGFMIAVSAASLVGAALNTLLFSRISYKTGEELREDVYHTALTFSKNEFDKFGVSSLITRTTNDVTQVQNLIEMGLKFLILAPVQLIGGIVMTWLLSPELALIFIGAIPFLAVSYLIISCLANPLYSRMQTLLDQLNLSFKEGLTGVKVIRAFCREDAEFEKYHKINGEYAKVSIAAGGIMSFFFPVISLLLSLSTLLILWAGGAGAENGTLEVGSIIAAISYGAQILTGFAMLTQIILAVPRGQTSAKRIHEVLEMPLSIQDPSGSAPQACGKSLTFENVDFRYFGGEKKTLSGISLTVHGGQTLAVIGSTGDGKSSLVSLIARLYDVEKGQIRLNGADVRELPQKVLHDRVSFVPQASTLFFGTIRSNLLVGRPDATDEEIWAALDMAQASDFIHSLDLGLDSIVEKAGGNFSGGQKQRLCIARALLKEADVYVFDDSFSALDFKTDAAIRSAMRGRVRDAVIVAQRVSTVMNADLIAVLDNGMLAGLGTHEELKDGCSVYRQIIESQLYKEVA